MDISYKALDQIPFVLGFIVFALGMLKFVQKWMQSQNDAHNKIVSDQVSTHDKSVEVAEKTWREFLETQEKNHIARMEKAEGAWREFLVEQRRDFLQSIEDVMCTVAELKHKQEEHSQIIAAHDKKLDLAIATMTERTKARARTKTTPT